MLGQLECFAAGVAHMAFEEKIAAFNAQVRATETEDVLGAVDGGVAQPEHP